LHRVEGRLVLSPSDLTGHQECHHFTVLNLAVANGRLQRPTEAMSDQTALVADLGVKHELRYLESLEEQGTAPTPVDSWGGVVRPRERRG
jgi:uncharacterized protein